MALYAVHSGQKIEKSPFFGFFSSRTHGTPIFIGIGTSLTNKVQGRCVRRLMWTRRGGAARWRLLLPRASFRRKMNALMKVLILAPCCFFFIALIKLLYDYLWIPLRIQHMLNSQGIKGPPYRFIHGNNKEVTKMKQKALSKSVGLTDDIFPKVQPHIYTWTNRY
ncbi:hypothetical protein Gotur_008208, partial [Gossypium turneri]